MVDIRAQIVAQLRAIPNIGPVYDYQPYADNLKDLAAFYIDNKKLLGWFVRRLALKEQFLTTAVGKPRVIQRDTKWQIKGYMALNYQQQSELVFDALVTAIVDSFRAFDSYDAELFDDDAFTCRVGNQTSAALDASQPLLFANVLCHSADMSLFIRQRLFDYPS